MENEDTHINAETPVTGTSAIPSAARRALDEAEKRRERAVAAAHQKEIAGRGGVEPTRYGDWEVKGLATDF